MSGLNGPCQPHPSLPLQWSLLGSFFEACPPLQERLQTPLYRERKPLIFQRVGCSFGEPRRPHQPAR